MELTKETIITPDFVFETSWEICNKIGGIYTVISTKARLTAQKLGEKYVVIGPDVWKQTTANPDFNEIPGLFSEWKAVAFMEGLKVRTGKWNIPGSPNVILIDFTPLFPEKDKIFAHFWEKYHLDSIRGEWSYIEAAMFGYAAGQVINSFTNHQLQDMDNIVAHFHEWMTGAGVLYLKDVNPKVSTVFTTHATALGRSIAGNGQLLYQNLKKYQPEKTARDFNISAQHSLESIAAREADVLTTVSDITSRECKQFFDRKPEIITTNGFDEGFIPKETIFQERKTNARNKALEVASQRTGKSYPEDTLLLMTSGRYEYTNKGIDLFIKALGLLNSSKKLTKKVVAYIAVPADHDGVVDQNRENHVSPDDKYLTHKLFHPNHDSILKEIKRQGLGNDESSMIDILFAPVYLDKKDGVIDLDYYDFLIGFDLTLFPSYYEPWGYTPLESIAFNIPTLTTAFAGFGDWTVKNSLLEHKSVTVISRPEGLTDQAVTQIASTIEFFAGPYDTDKNKSEIKQLFEKAQWQTMINNYFNAWDEAINRSESRKSKLPPAPPTDTLLLKAQAYSDKPVWKKILVQNILPNTLKSLKDLAYNLWWSWNDDASQLFASIDEEKWRIFENNPVHLIESLSKVEIDKLAADEAFLNLLNKVHARFEEYMSEAKNKPEEMVAYFSMEYGLHNSLKIYSGGLGILAGDYLKQASDSNKNLVAVGLLYRYGYFKQSLSVYGDQLAEYTAQKFTQLPILPVRHGNGEWAIIQLAFPGRNVSAKVWQVNVGRIKLYLLDTDTEDNTVEDRSITYQLYGGDNENRIKQELILGIGGVRMIESIGLQPTIYHSNEGHSAFIGLERILNLMKDPNVNFEVASELVRATNLFTTHTPVPAGHDTFEEHLIRTYLPHYCEQFRISWNDFMGLGRYSSDNPTEKFSMSVLATRLSQEVNGVSRIHGRVSREMFQPLYPGYFAEELHIGYVTN
ncbi:MAG: alpha-glucan family phosphorylase, partial [Bacteroidales bacterium]